MCRINSGLFHVKWEDTKRLVESIEVVDGEDGEVVRGVEAWEREETN